MVFYQISLKIRHECPYLKLTETYPSASIYVWCNRQTEVIELKVDNPEEYQDAVKQLHTFTETEPQYTDHRTYRAIRRCVCVEEDAVLHTMDMFNLYSISPIIHRKGWEYYNFIAFNHQDFEILLETLQTKGYEVIITNKQALEKNLVELCTLPIGTMFETMTTKQIDILIQAYNHGYFSFPRETNVQTLATQLKTPRTTISDHLKKAQGKLMENLIPYLLLERNNR